MSKKRKQISNGNINGIPIKIISQLKEGKMQVFAKPDVSKSKEKIPIQEIVSFPHFIELSEGSTFHEDSYDGSQLRHALVWLNEKTIICTSGNNFIPSIFGGQVVALPQTQLTGVCTIETNSSGATLQLSEEAKVIIREVILWNNWTPKKTSIKK